jgi:hypothetical protein
LSFEVVRSAKSPRLQSIIFALYSPDLGRKQMRVLPGPSCRTRNNSSMPFEENQAVPPRRVHRSLRFSYSAIFQTLGFNNPAVGHQFRDRFHSRVAICSRFQPQLSPKSPGFSGGLQGSFIQGWALLNAILTTLLLASRVAVINAFSIYVHRGRYLGVPHEFLLHADRRFGAIQPRPKVRQPMHPYLPAAFHRSSWSIRS